MFDNRKVVGAADEKAFYGHARDWEADRQTQLEKSEHRAWRVALGASIIALVAVGGIVSMAPFKRVVPYVFEVDKATGNTELVEAANPRTTVAYQELLDKHWAQAYVIARESYMYRLLQTDYDTTLALSSDEVGRSYAKLYDGPNALDSRLGAATEIHMAGTVANPKLDEKAVLEGRLATDKPQARNWKYSQSAQKGSEDIIPAMIFDDGRFTYFKFPANREIPTVFYISPSGEEERVNFHMAGDLAVVERLGRRFVLRLGKSTVGIWNEAFDPDGAASEGGTTVPGVDREVK